MTTWWFPNVSKIFYFPLGKWSILTNIFQMGWFNHQLEWRYFRIYLKLLIPNCPKSHLWFFNKHNKRPCNIEKTTWDFSGNHFQNHGKTWVLGLKIKDSLPCFPNNKIPHQQKPTEFDPDTSRSLIPSKRSSLRRTMMTRIHVMCQVLESLLLVSWTRQRWKRRQYEL